MDTSACSELLCGRPTMKASLKQNVWQAAAKLQNCQNCQNLTPCNNPWHLRPAPRSSDDLSLTHVLSCCAHYCHNVHLQIIYLSISMFLNDLLIDVVTSHGKQLVVVVVVSLLRLADLSHVAHIVVDDESEVGQVDVRRAAQVEVVKPFGDNSDSTDNNGKQP